MLAKCSYSSEAWNSATYFLDASGKPMSTYKRDDHNTADATLPDYAITANRCFRKWFCSGQVRSDIKIKKKAGKIKSFHDIPLLPSQTWILKDMMAILDIADPKTTMRLEDFLPPLPDRERQMRSSNQSLLMAAFKDSPLRSLS